MMDELTYIEIEITELYRRVFTTDPGQKVLTHMLTELFFFTEPQNDEQRILANYGRHLMTILGPFLPEQRRNVVRSLMDIRLLEDKQGHNLMDEKTNGD